MSSGKAISCSNVDPQYTGTIPGLRPANERRRYKVTPSLIGWAQAKNQPRVYVCVYDAVR